MKKRFSITISDYIFKDFLNDTDKNRSNYIEMLIVKGSLAIINQETNLKGKILDLTIELSKKDQEIKRLNFELNKLRSARGFVDPDLERKENIVKALKMRGF